VTVTTIQCPPETGPGDSKDKKGLPAGVVPEQATSTGFTQVRLLVKQIGGTMSHTSSGKGTTFSVAIPRSYESNKSGVSNR
jgi:two-component sensor histidine kinase